LVISTLLTSGTAELLQLRTRSFDHIPPHEPLAPQAESDPSDPQVNRQVQ